MLKIEDLHTEIDGKEILKGLTLTVNAGEVHAIMGPNGAGKSTLGYVLGGRPGYEVTGGSVMFRAPSTVRAEPVEARAQDADLAARPSTGSGRTGGSGPFVAGPGSRSGDDAGASVSGEGLDPGLRRGADGNEAGEWIDLLSLEPHERAAAGLFLGFQYPVEIPGVSNVQFLREALNAQRAGRDEKPLSGGEFLKLAREQAAALQMDAEMLKRPVNVGFSGGEKKRNEMVQMGIIDPAFAILDETDSGLDIDALRIVGDGINRIMRQKPGGPDKAVLLITHYQRLLDYVQPDFVHVLADGRITRTGGAELARQLEAEGYAGVAA